MKMRTSVGAAAIAAIAGLAVAQPTVDGVYDPGTEGSFYSNVLWSQNQPTAFGDNEAGDFVPGGGSAGDPENVTTGAEIRVPKSLLGSATSFRLAGWINSGDRTFMSNQIIHTVLPTDTQNIGGAPNFETDSRFPGLQHVTVSGIPTAAITVDGTLDAGYTRYFLQTNFTQFGNSTAGTPIGGGGSEIDAVYVAQDATSYYIFVAGNVEANGNGLDLYFDTDNGATGQNVLSSGSGAGAFIPGGQSGLTFDAGFAANAVVSVDSTDPGTGRVPRLYAGSLSGSIDEIGTASAFGAAGATAFSGSYALALDNSNIIGVGGSPVNTADTPVAPDSNWAYGSEINNIRSYIDTANNRLYVFIGGNVEVNGNKIELFFDAAPGGQNQLRVDNVDISFNGLNRMGGMIFDSGFSPDYWMNINNNYTDTANLVNFTDAATLRTNGPLVDPFFGVISDYGSFFGGDVEEPDGTPVASPLEVMDFSGPRADIQDGSFGSLFANYAPRLLANDPLNPQAALLVTSIDNSNVGGVSSSSAAGAELVNTGIEISIDLDELGWDGQQDILIAGFINGSSHDFVSNQVIGGLPDAANLGDPVNVDFSQIAGDQFVNLSATIDPCDAIDLNGDMIIDFGDVGLFVTAFSGGNLAADVNGDGLLDFGDVGLFVSLFTQCQ